MQQTVNPDAAGVDIASKEHYVAVPEGRSKHQVRCFGSFTEDLHRLAGWLKDCKVRTVAMESTGVYWYHLYTVLLGHGFEVLLVNAHHVKNVPGRKSDVSDAKWLQQLHTFGLLNGCFQPDNLTRALRDYMRQRKQVVTEMTTQVQRVQKALELMNIKLNNTIRDIMGKTGRAIVESILAGERDPKKLALHRDKRIKAPRETLEASLEGNWREEQLFNLALAYKHYQFLEGQLQECDQRLEAAIKKLDSGHAPNGGKLPKKAKRQKNQPRFDVERHLYQCLGVDTTRISGMGATTALTIFSETGPGLAEKFPTEKQFLSWANVVPDNKISGGKVLSSRVRRKKSRVGQAFRDAAKSLWRSKCPLGEYLRAKKARSGAAKAIVATARKIASIYYNMVTKKVGFDLEKLKRDKRDSLEQKARYLEKKLYEVKSLIADNQEDISVVI